MTNNLRETLFGFRSRRNAEAFAELKAATAPQPFNESGTTIARRRSPRIIGITEQRLRARNQPFWTIDLSAWRKLLAR